MQESYKNKALSRLSERSRTAMPRRRSSLPTVRQSKSEDEGLLPLLIKNGLIGLGGFVLSGIMLVTAACAAAYACPDPTSLIAPLSLAALLPSSFIGGFITVKLTRQSPLLCGIVCGAMCAIAMLGLSLIFTGAPTSSYTFFQGLLLHALALLFCVLGALTGNYKRKPNPRKRRFGN